MKLATSLIIALAMTFSTASLVSAQTATPSSTASKPSTTAAKPKKERTEKSKECSAQADAKGLHGKERKKFRSECKAGK
jgi:hypothetical protein